jgi:hypothetical protein
VTSEKEYQEKIRRLGALVGEIDQTPGNPAGVAARELAQLLLEVHSAGLERMMEIAFEAGDSGEAVIRKFGQDPIVRNLLFIYSLHPDDLETRVLKALDIAGAYLRKFDSKVVLLSIHEGSVQLRLHTSGHGCGSTAKNLKSVVEASIYEMAPDLASLEILGTPEESASGFVPLDNLLKQTLDAQTVPIHSVADGAN